MLTPDFTVFPVLETKRLLLRQLVSEDVEEIYFLRSDKEVLRFIGREPAKEREEAAAFIKMITDNIQSSESVLWGIVFKENPAKVIGTICFWNITRENYRSEIGFVLNPEYWRKGIMKEAILEVLNYGFSVMGLHSVEARIASGNSASAAVLVSTGFEQEGYLKEEFYFQGQFTDTIIYSRRSK